MNELAFGLRHRGQNLYTLVRRHKPMVFHVSYSCSCRRLNFEYILSKRLFHQLDEFSVLPGKGHEFIRIHNVTIRFVHLRIDAKRLRETSIALRYLALIRTVWGKGSLSPSWA